MIELHVVDHGDVGEVLQELRRLVEEGAVVLIALDDEVASLAHPVARSAFAEVQGDTPDEHAWIGARLREQPSSQRGRRRLAVRAGNDDRAGAPQKMLANGFRQ